MSLSPEFDGLHNFHLAIENFEYVESLFNNGDVDLQLIHHGLYQCCERLDILISEETVNSPYFFDLVQLKQFVMTLIEILEKYMTQRVASPANAKQANKTPIVETEQKFVDSIKEIPRVSGLTEIAGLWEVKKLLKSLIILPMNQPQLFVNHKPGNSILLFGPPGTGKTRLVHALAFEAKAELYCFSTSMLSSFVGQTEKNVQILFEYIRNDQRFSILFIDEVDGFCRTRNDSEQDHTRRLKTELLCQMSKIEDLRHIFLICATNCPWDLDTAFLRRFHKRIYVPLPNATERHEIFHLFTKNTPLDAHSEHWQSLIEQTDGLSGSELSNLIQSALNIPIMELEDTKIWKCDVNGFYEPVMSGEDFNLENIIYCDLNDLPRGSVRARTVQILDLFKSLDGITPTVSATNVKKYETFIGK